MKRIIGAAIAALLASALLAVVPASAHGVDVCVGQGTAATSAPVYYPTFGPSVPAGQTANFSLSVGGCLVDPVGHSGAVAGTFQTGVVLPSPLPDLGNYCGHSEGTTNGGGHLGQWVSAASMLVVVPTGVTPGTNMAGVVNAVPDVLAGQSCTAGATSFLVTGAVVLF